MSELVSVTVKLPKEQYKTLKNISEKTKKNLSEVIREKLNEALEIQIVNENTNLIANVVRKQLDIVLKPHVERLASLSAKSGHMSATSAFLNLQALLDFVPEERRRDIKEQYNNARAKAVEYMKIKTTDFDDESILK